ncbi:FtsX-like permease family protein [Paenibacillus sp. SN-8-1]|uniref:FtsX-like permease family protein n=1 Tax=Paenibacillus sp. SN-8-1 TaxID=3435409 RepID=UPI003D9A9649
MLSSMKGLNVRFFKYNKFITVTSIIGIALSIYLVVIMTLFSYNAKASVNQEFKQIYGNMDMSVGYDTGKIKVIDKSLYDTISSQAGVKEASPVLISRLPIEHLNADIYTVGVGNDELAKSRYHFHENISNSQVILNKSLAETLKVRAGSVISIENRQFVVKEIIEDLDGVGVMPDLFILPHTTLTDMLERRPDTKNTFATYILLSKAGNNNVYSLAENIRLIDKDLRVDVAEENEALKQNLSQLNYFMIILSIFLLVVTSLFIISNFEVLFYKYKNQFAIMRSLGATTRQIFDIVLQQSVIINICGTAFGFLSAVASYQLLMKYAASLFSIKISVVQFPLFQTVTITLCCMVLLQTLLLVPCYRYGRILPVRMMQESEKIDFSNQKLRKVIGYSLVVLSLCSIVLGLTSSYGTRALDLLLGALFVVFGIFILYPIYMRAILTKLLPLFKKVLGNSSYVAVKNVIPQIRKNTFITLAIGAMMIINIFGSSLLKTLELNNDQYLRDQYVTNVVLTNRSTDSNQAASEIRNELHRLFDSENASLVSNENSVVLSTNKTNNYASGYSLVDLDEMKKQGLVKDEMDHADNGIVITRKLADTLGIERGDQLNAALYPIGSGENIPVGKLTVEYITDKLPGTYAEIYIDWKNSKFHFPYMKIDRVFIGAHQLSEITPKINTLKKLYPEFKVHTFEDALQESKQMFQQRWFLFIAVMVIVMLSVILGVINSLINNIHTRRKEFAILRALSLSKQGLIKVILTQVYLYLISGLILGITTGLLLTYIVGLIDGVRYDFQSIILVSGIIMAIALVVFTPFATHIGNRKIIGELAQDNK